MNNALHFNIYIIKRPKMISQNPLFLNSIWGRSPFNFKRELDSKLQDKRAEVDECFGKVASSNEDGWVTFSCAWVEQKKNCAVAGLYSRKHFEFENCIGVKLREYCGWGEKKAKSWGRCFEWSANGKRGAPDNENQVRVEVKQIGGLGSRDVYAWMHFKFYKNDVQYTIMMRVQM